MMMKMKLLLVSRTAAVLVVLSILSGLASTTVHGRPLIDSDRNSTSTSTITTIAAGSLDYYDSNEDSSSLDVMLPEWASGTGITRHGFGSNVTFPTPMQYPASKFKFDNDHNNNGMNRLGGRAKGVASTSTTTTDEEDDAMVYDVVIVGAGAAGMGAARRLRLSGVTNVVILEATSGLGGRMQVDTDFTGYPLDLGASYLVGQFFKTELEQIAGRSLSTTNLLGRPLWKNYSYNDFFTEHVAPDLDIRYNCVVIEVNYQEENDSTRINCANGHTFLAKYTVVTASIQILKDKDIAFIPTIEPKRYNHRNLWPGIKIFLQYENKFYKNRLKFIPLPPELDSKGENKCWDGTVSAPDRNSVSNLLVCYFTGNRANTIYGTPNESKNKVETIFENYFNLPQGSINTENYLIVDWRSKPFVKGAYSNVSNQPNFYKTVVNPEGKNSVILAGEAYPIPGEEYGWVWSAFHSGFNAADQIMALMVTRPSPVTTGPQSPNQLPTQSPTIISPTTSSPTVRPTLSQAPVFENLGKGFCRDSTGNYNEANWKKKSACVDLTRCANECQGTDQCLGISWASTPFTTDDGCKANSLPRCVVYSGTVVVSIEKTSVINAQYTCYRYSKPVPIPTAVPTNTPTNVPTDASSNAPTNVPTDVPTNAPTNVPTDVPTNTTPTNVPTDAQTNAPTNNPTDVPMKAPTNAPADAPTDVPATIPSGSSSVVPTFGPSMNPSSVRSVVPSPLFPSHVPSGVPSIVPTITPTTNKLTVQCQDDNSYAFKNKKKHKKYCKNTIKKNKENKKKRNKLCSELDPKKKNKPVSTFCPRYCKKKCRARTQKQKQKRPQ